MSKYREVMLQRRGKINKNSKIKKITARHYSSGNTDRCTKDISKLTITHYCVPNYRLEVHFQIHKETPSFGAISNTHILSKYNSRRISNANISPTVEIRSAFSNAQINSQLQAGNAELQASNSFSNAKLNAKLSGSGQINRLI